MFSIQHTVAVVEQIEFYFGPFNLSQDPYLLSIIGADGWVLLAEICSWPRMAQLGASDPFQVARAIVSFSLALDVDASFQFVRLRGNPAFIVPGPFVSSRHQPQLIVPRHPLAQHSPYPDFCGSPLPPHGHIGHSESSGTTFQHQYPVWPQSLTMPSWSVQLPGRQPVTSPTENSTQFSDACPSTKLQARAGSPDLSHQVAELPCQPGHYLPGIHLQKEPSALAAATVDDPNQGDCQVERLHSPLSEHRLKCCIEEGASSARKTLQTAARSRDAARGTKTSPHAPDRRMQMNGDTRLLRHEAVRDGRHIERGRSQDKRKQLLSSIGHKGSQRDNLQVHAHCPGAIEKMASNVSSDENDAKRLGQVRTTGPRLRCSSTHHRHSKGAGLQSCEVHSCGPPHDMKHSRCMPDSHQPFMGATSANGLSSGKRQTSQRWYGKGQQQNGVCRSQESRRDGQGEHSPLHPANFPAFPRARKGGFNTGSENSIKGSVPVPTLAGKAWAKKLSSVV
ncbi:unnamed protein product [Chondrus crispus]|uniref:HTH La-type RNA-binding domain-containing protein n=1 Tax=Chondrus crispus TaxID=2769 RepID=R7QH39_CHOCR|nr:unnamed protein product [Chondrus crispus]CDF36740.1 unnamed protein product [Chondrus crispus]|eukprot:XP_005716559.1 unnamed protein product [Chondrus crispus]